MTSFVACVLSGIFSSLNIAISVFIPLTKIPNLSGKSSSDSCSTSRRFRISLYSDNFGWTFYTNCIQDFCISSSSVWQVISMYSLALASELTSDRLELSEMKVSTQFQQLNLRSQRSFMNGSMDSQDEPSR